MKNLLKEYNSGLEKVKKNDEFGLDGEIEQAPPIEKDEYGEKKVTEYFWSCCMNSDKNSPGCQKIEERKFKY